MIHFDASIVEILNGCFSRNEESVESVLLASYGFNIQFANLSIQCSERVFASIGGVECTWDDSPNSGPWGALGRQVAKFALLKRPDLLSIAFESGDSIDIETVEGQYESVVFSFPRRGDSSVMEVF